MELNTEIESQLVALETRLAQLGVTFEGDAYELHDLMEGISLECESLSESALDENAREQIFGRVSLACKALNTVVSEHVFTSADPVQQIGN